MMGCEATNEDEVLYLILNTARDILSGKTDIGNRCIQFAMLEQQEMAEATLALVSEEICAKYCTNVTRFFDECSLALNGCDVHLTQEQKSVIEIGRAICARWCSDAAWMFEKLATISSGIIRDYGKYEGGF